MRPGLTAASGMLTLPRPAPANPRRLPRVATRTWTWTRVRRRCGNPAKLCRVRDKAWRRRCCLVLGCRRDGDATSPVPPASRDLMGRDGGGNRIRRLSIPRVCWVFLSFCGGCHAGCQVESALGPVAPVALGLPNQSAASGGCQSDIQTG